MKQLIAVLLLTGVSLGASQSNKDEISKKKVTLLTKEIEEKKKHFKMLTPLFDQLFDLALLKDPNHVIEGKQKLTAEELSNDVEKQLNNILKEIKVDKLDLETCKELVINLLSCLNPTTRQLLPLCNEKLGKLLTPFNPLQLQQLIELLEFILVPETLVEVIEQIMIKKLMEEIQKNPLFCKQSGLLNRSHLFSEKCFKTTFKLEEPFKVAIDRTYPCSFRLFHFSPANNAFLARERNEFTLYDFSGKPITTFTQPEGFSDFYVTFSPDGNFFTIIFISHTELKNSHLSIWDFKQKKALSIILDLPQESSFVLTKEPFFLNDNTTLVIPRLVENNNSNNITTELGLFNCKDGKKVDTITRTQQAPDQIALDKEKQNFILLDHITQNTTRITKINVQSKEITTSEFIYNTGGSDNLNSEHCSFTYVSDDQGKKIWDNRTGKEVVLNESLDDASADCFITKNETYFVTNDSEESPTDLRIFDMQTGKVIFRINKNKEACHVWDGFCSDETLFVTRETNSNYRYVWDTTKINKETGMWPCVKILKNINCSVYMGNRYLGIPNSDKSGWIYPLKKEKKLHSTAARIAFAFLKKTELESKKITKEEASSLKELIMALPQKVRYYFTQKGVLCAELNELDENKLNKD